MASPLLSRDGMELCEAAGVFTLTMTRGENRVNPEFVALLSQALELVEAAPSPKVLVITSKGKFFCNGLDLEWMQTQKGDSLDMVESFWKCLARLLVMDCHTVAAINGHGFGAGMFLSLACDWRVMQTGRGFLNFPEANLGMRLRKGFSELAKCKLSPHTLRRGVLAAHRFSAEEALKCGVVDEVCSAEDLGRVAHEFALSKKPDALDLLRFSGHAFRQVKMELYTDAYRALTGPGTAEPDSRL
ncbi:unnamed protein product [Polarella glacialis]|uniref:Uncharacterized protein n=1 Tax=Polarella glacialis TaxID=89957 RepID=A0A813LJK4_POLGL|nr:unnamed protein product [Polarella glacialis]CAE8732802.1 unnamed protein product [Polarella glacialis]